MRLSERINSNNKLSGVVPLPPPSEGQLWAWGYNLGGQLGLNNATNYSSPVQVGSYASWRKIAAHNGAHGIKADGTLWSWGDNTNGRLGVGNTIPYSSPVQVGALTSWVSASASPVHSAFIRSDGTLWTVGTGNLGQLGVNNTNNYTSPVQVGGLTTWKTISASGYSGCTHAIKTDGTLWAFGENGLGNLGTGNTTSYSSPVQVGALTNWLDLSGGNYHSVAVKTDGTIWAWGYNAYGGLGFGVSGAIYSSPVQIGSGTNWKQVSCGIYTSGAVKTDGTLWMWGLNNTGQLGLGNTLSYSSPVQVGSLTTWKEVTVSGTSTYAVKTDGTLWAWGDGASGALGNNGTANYSSPIQIGSLTTWVRLGDMKGSSGFALKTS